jgi:magnesium chelatase family protein
MHYQKKLYGPILDRIDIHVTVGQIKLDKLLDKKDANASPALKTKIQQARQCQYQRQGEVLNGKLINRDIKEHANLSSNAKLLLYQAADKLELSPRSYMKVTKVARTIADIEGSYQINTKHIAEALQYRPKNNINIV